MNTHRTTSSAYEPTVVDPDANFNTSPTRCTSSTFSDTTARESLGQEACARNQGVKPGRVKMNSWWVKWLFELLAIIMSAGALIAIVAVLINFQGKTLSSWHAILQPNTVIAILDTISKSSMLLVIEQGLGQLKWVYFEQRPQPLIDFETFDEASRGPLGSAQLLVKIRGKAIIASLGAFITLVALAMDPFVQQVISYEQQMLNATGNISTLASTRIYDPDLGEPSDYSSIPYIPDVYNSKYSRIWKMTDSKHDPFMTETILGGLFGNVGPAPYSCSSGHCSWNQFESLGICTSCDDVTAATVVNCNGPYPVYEGIQDWVCGFSLPSGLYLEAFKECATSGSTQAAQSALDYTIWNSTVNAANLSSMGMRNGTIANIGSIYFPNPDQPETTQYCASPLEGAIVTECTFRWCAKTYADSKVTNGTLQDRPTETQPLSLMGSMPCLHNDGQNEEEQRSLIPAFKLNDTRLFSCEDGVKSDKSLAQSLFHAPNVFLLNPNNTQYLAYSIASTFTASLCRQVILGVNTTAQTLYRAQREGRLEQLMANVATSMTNQVRASTNNTIVEGVVQYPDTIITVQWLWMMLPALLVLLSIIFFVASIIFSAENSQSVWKCSALAGLFHGVEGWDDHELRKLRLHDIEESAKGMKVHLRDNGDNVKLVRYVEVKHR